MSRKTAIIEKDMKFGNANPLCPLLRLSGLRAPIRKYSLVPNKCPPPRLLIFGNFSPPPEPYFDPPPLINLGKFLFHQLQNIQKYTVNEGYFD